MPDAKLVTIPLATSPTLELYIGIALSNLTKYQTVISSLQYLSLTRFDIIFLVSKLSKFMQRPTNDHWIVVKHLFGIFVAHLIMV